MTIAFPYRTVRDDNVTTGDWLLVGRDGQPYPIVGSIPGWDYDTELRVRRRLQLKPLRILDETGLTDQPVELRLNVVTLTGPTSYRNLQLCLEIPLVENWFQDIDLRLDSRKLAEALTLRTEVVLGDRLDHGLRFVASAAGSRLFHDSQKIQLEGSLGRFPMELLDFDASLPGLRASNAMWYLDWDPTRPESHFLGTVLLYINSANDEIAERVRNMEPAVMSILRCDVIRAMCEVMLRSDDFLAGFHYFDSDTVGGQVRDWLVAAFGDVMPEVLVMLLRSSPGRFEARLQEAFS